MMTQPGEHKQKLAYGLWKSKISPEVLSAAIQLSDPQWDSDGKTLVWRELRSGMGVVVAQPLGEAPFDVSGEINVQGGVGYGGGDFCVRRGLVIFAGRDGRLYRCLLSADFPSAITPEFGGVASPVLSLENEWVAFVQSYEGHDVIGLVDSGGKN